MRRGGSAAALIVLALAAPLAQADWLMAGADPARTGRAGAGPLDPDLAFEVRLPGLRADASAPLVVGRAVYAATTDVGAGNADENALWRIGLDDASVTRLAALESPPSGLASDGARLFVAQEGRIVAFPLEGGDPAWATPLPARVPNASNTTCAPFALAEGALYAACTDGAGRSDGAAVTLVLALALDAETGRLLWSWSDSPGDRALQRVIPTGAPLVQPAAGVRGLSVTLMDPFVLVLTDELGGSAQEVNVLRRDDGAFWSNVSADPDTGAYTDLLGTGGGAYVRHFGWPTRAGDLALLAREDLVAYKPLARQVAWRVPIGEQDAQNAGGHSLAVDEERIFVSSLQALEAFDAASHAPAWNVTLPVASGLAWGTTGLARAGDLLYARAFQVAPYREDFRIVQEVERTVLFAFDAATGEERWNLTVLDESGFHPVPTRTTQLQGHLVETAVGEGALVAAALDGRILVIGPTGASLALAPSVSTSYPPLGEEVRIDLSGGRAGARGAATRWRAEWGDGAATDWQDSPVLAHAYAARGSVEATFFAQNDAGDATRTRLALHPGEPDPDARTLADALRGPLPLLAGLLFAAAGTGAYVRARRRPEAPRPGAWFLGRWRVERALSEGAFGQTWLARDRAGRGVVIKGLHPAWARVGSARARFRRETEILASLEHPNVIRWLDSALVEGTLYAVMEYAEGGDLAQRIARGPLPRAEALAALDGLLAGLEHIHARGIVHRDLKPSNVLFGADGAPRLADFGVAHWEEASGLTVDQEAPGTPLYMAPEQVRRRPLDARADLYALAAVAVEMLTGRYYLDVDPRDHFALQQAILGAPPRLAGIDPPLAAVLARALAKEPEERPADAAAMRALLATLRLPA